MNGTQRNNVLKRKRIAGSHILPTKTSKRSRPAPSSIHLLPTGTHPYGIKPTGNYLLDASKGIKECRSPGLGPFMCRLPDEMVLDLLGKFDPVILGVLAQCSRALYCFTYHEELWRKATVERFGGTLGTFKGTWRNTYKYRHVEMKNVLSLYTPDTPIPIPTFYSDLLFASWRCANVPLKALCNPSHSTIDRVSSLTLDDFVTNYAIPNKPVVITDVVPTWPAFERWSLSYFQKQYGDRLFRAEAVDIPFSDYVSYAESCNEESPLYLFDKKFGEGTTLAEEYTVPEYFWEDFFSVLGDQRPDYRWLIVGPERSGSTFHVDPNSTSAWNAVITGSKKWILYPPEIIPPGVFPTADGSEVTTPLSLAEWFLNHYEETKHSATPPIEGVCKAGEVLFVPNGWWHCVMNLEPSIAITQNFVSTQNLPNVLRFLRCKRDQVSGVDQGEGLYEKFVEGFERTYPGVLERLGLGNKCEEGEGNETQKDKVGLWDRIGKKGVGEEEEKEDGGLFMFSFGQPDQ
ncbi:hypothetical protein HK104_000249 [Borealophlyctis nickersoniae]|nr:hypothetical protein HK104_000249 [Borealophlyctis nickersoniae]